MLKERKELTGRVSQKHVHRKMFHHARPTLCVRSIFSVFFGLLVCFSLVAVEAPYDFRTRLEQVHAPDRREAAVVCAANEFAFTDGAVLILPENADEVLTHAVRDFQDYLAVSMKIDALVSTARKFKTGAMTIALDQSVGARCVEIDIDEAVHIRAFDSRAAAQALYHLEDRMNLKKGPFLEKGTFRRKAIFDVRMAHSGYGNDMFPEAHLKQMAHAGYTAILVFLDEIDKTKMLPYQDIKALIRLAKAHGLDTYLYSYIRAFHHPDEGQHFFDASYGRIAGYYPEAKGIILVGESCEFPSKDPRVQPGRSRRVGRDKNDPRPLAGWFPCQDYPDWLQAVKRAIHAKAPEMELVFWTYNWGWAPQEDRLRLIDSLPTDITVMATFEMFERLHHRNGLECPIADYSLAFAGPGKYFISEATRAKMRGLTLATQAMASGPTWDFGCVPYQPCPYQWKKRWDALVAANRKWNLSRVMENHHNGWYPAFVSELEKEALTEGGIPFDAHIRLIASRDYGPENAAKVLAIWKSWSDHARDYVPTDINQYGPFRIGPAYPFTFGHPVADAKQFPVARYASNGIGICRLDYLNTTFVVQNMPECNDVDYMKKEIELFEPMARSYETGADAFAAMSGAKAQAMANFAGYLASYVRTAINIKRGAIAFRENNQQGILEAAKDEYRNARAAIRFVESDSRLGWEPTMEYCGGPEQIRWKLDLMEKYYGKDILSK